VALNAKSSFQRSCSLITWKESRRKRRNLVYSLCPRDGCVKGNRKIHLCKKQRDLVDREGSSNGLRTEKVKARTLTRRRLWHPSCMRML
jgi:hypothetical protein